MVASTVRLTVLWAALAVLAGCGGTTSQAPDQTAQAPEQAAPVTQAPEQATVAPEQGTQAPEQATEELEQDTKAPEQATESSGQATAEPAQASPEEPVEKEAPSEEKPAAAQPEAKAQAASPAEEPSAEEDLGEPDVIFVPTPQAVVDKMLELADIKEGNVIYDLGCGDGRIVVTAAKKYGVKAYGFDIDPQRIQESLENVKKNKVEDLVTIRHADIFKLDLSEADVVTLYLLPRLNVQLMPQLEKLKPGSRIVSHDFDMRGAKPEQVITMTAESDSGFESEHTIYLWTVPWEKEE